MCCQEDRYCFLTTEWEVKCCAEGTTCPYSPCAETEYYCNKTFTAEDGSPTQRTGCCARNCGSATNYTACSVGMGGGCCPVDTECTIYNGAPGCYPENPTPSSVPETGGNTEKKLKIGLSVGLVALVGCLGGICFYLWRRRRRARARAQQVDRSASADGWPFNKPELPGDGASAVPPRYELPEDTLRELPGEGMTPELPEALDGRPHELPDSSVTGQSRGND